MRLINIMVIGLLILAASFVYKIKFDSTLQAERVAKLRGELNHERNAIAVLRAEWAKLDSPGRIQALSDRHLPLRLVVPNQFDNLDRLPDRPPMVVPSRAKDPIGAMLAPTEPAESDNTGSIYAPPTRW